MADKVGAKRSFSEVTTSPDNQASMASSSDKIKLYSLATPNGQKIGVALVEMGIPYEATTINIFKNTQFEDWYVKINPNSKIPSIVDPKGPDGKEIAMMESGAILLYLAEKSGKFLSKDPVRRLETLQWLFFQVAHIGPMSGQYGHFHKYAKDKCDHPYPEERYKTEVTRLLGVLEKRLEGRDYLIDDGFSIADMAIFPWLQCIRGPQGYGSPELVEEFKNVTAYLDRCLARPAVQRGMEVTPFPKWN